MAIPTPPYSDRIDHAIRPEHHILIRQAIDWLMEDRWDDALDLLTHLTRILQTRGPTDAEQSSG